MQMSAPSAGLRAGDPTTCTRLRLLCFASAGSSAVSYRRWSRLLPRDIEVCPMELPGRGARWNEPLEQDFDSAVDRMLTLVLPLLSKPVAFFGHSLGALLAFQLVRRLHLHGLPLPVHLFASGARSPHTPRREGPLSALGDDEFLDYIVRLDGTPERVLRDPTAMDLYLPILRADAKLFDSFRHGRTVPIPVPLSVSGGDADPEVLVEDLNGWRQHTSAAFQLDVYPGGHFYFRSEEARFVERIAERITF